MDLPQHLVGDSRFLLAQLQLGEELPCRVDGQRRHFIDRASADADVARFAAQPRAAAIRARQIAAIPAQEHADVHLVFLPLEPAEEAADALEVAVALDDELPLLVGEVGPRHVETDAGLPRRALQLSQLRPVVRLAPRLDRALIDGVRRVRHDEIHVELDDVAEAVTGRTGAERVVE